MRTLLFILTSTILFSCTPEGQVYHEFQDLSPQLQWLKKDSREFKVPIEDNSIAYDMFITFRVSQGFQHVLIKVKVTETSPSGKETVNVYDLQTIENTGDYAGEAGYGIWDSKHEVELGKKYEETGTYTYNIEHAMDINPIEFAMEIGILLNKSN